MIRSVARGPALLLLSAAACMPPPISIGNLGQENPDLAVAMVADGEASPSPDLASFDAVAPDVAMPDLADAPDLAVGPDLAVPPGPRVLAFEVGIRFGETVTGRFVVADFNEDGLSDRAAVASGGGLKARVNVRFGDKASPFTKVANVEVQSTVGGEVVAGDINKDGHVDLAYAATPIIGALLGRGDGTFNAIFSLQHANNASSIALGDFDRDGKLDMAGSTYNVAGLFLLRGDGAGSFGGEVPLAAPRVLLDLMAIDVNGDGKVDLVGANRSSAPSTVTIYLGKGDGTFQAPSDIVVSQSKTAAITSLDYDGDGAVDLFVGTESGLSLLVGVVGGGLPILQTVGGIGATGGVALVDLNGDGKVDLASQSATCWLEVRPGLAPLKFDAPAGCYGPSFGSTPVFGDADGDGDLDYISLGEAALGRGDGTFHAPPMFLSAARDLSRQVVADINGDGKPDVVGVGLAGPTSLGVMLGNNDGTLRAGGATSLPVSPDGLGFDVVDLNGDHKLDVIISGLSLQKGMVTALGKGDGTFAVPVNTAGYGRALVTGDWNRDGKADVATVNNGPDNSLHVSLGLGDGTLAAPIDYNLAELHDIATGDFNRDGRVDLVTLCMSYFLTPDVGAVSMLAGVGDGTFAAPVVTRFTAVPTSRNPSRAGLLVGDLDGDGKLDLVFGRDASARDNGIFVLLGQGNGTFALPAAQPNGFYGSKVFALADLDGDGKLDIVAKTFNTLLTIGGTGVLLGKGQGLFSDPLRFADLLEQQVVMDLDADGKLDLVSIGSGSVHTFARNITR